MGKGCVEQWPIGQMELRILFSDQTKESRRGRSLSGASESISGDSGLQRVVALSVLAPHRRDGEAHLLPQRAGQEATNRVGLPAGGFHDFFKGGSVRPFQQVQNFGCLAPLACASGLLAGLGPLLSHGGLLTPLRLAARN